MENATERWVTKQNKNKSHLQSTRYKRCRHVSVMPLVRPWGFPWLPPGLTYWLCGLQRTVEQPDGSPGIQQFVFLQGLDPPFGVRITYSSVLCQSRGGRRGNSWQQERGRGGRGSNSLFLCVVLILSGGQEPESLKVILYSSKEQQRQTDDREFLLAAEVCYTSGEAVSAVKAQR